MTELWEKSFIERQTMWGFEPAESAIFANAFFVEKRVNNPSRQKRKMKTSRAIHPDFQSLLTLKEPEVIDLFCDLRDCILELYPESNELLYHTHALTAVFSISEKLSDAFCMLPIYTNHLNLGFNKGTLLKDPNKLFSGTGNLI
ncbi:MAG: hypothetical protein ACRD6X_19135, partial [Pyrinomonadaceae bacterium]